MKSVFPAFERHDQPVVPLRQFIVRLAHSGIIAVLLIALPSLLVGMVGYHCLVHLNWTDSFLNASMLLGGMGPVDVDRLTTFCGKLFAGLYALWCGLAVIVVAGVILAPVVHRILHKFHMESRGQ